MSALLLYGLDNCGKKTYNALMADEETLKRARRLESFSEETLKRARRAEDFIEEREEGGQAVSDEELKRWKEATGLMSPEGIIMMLVAIALDAPSIILLFFGLDDLGILDIVAVITIGLWFLLRSFSVEATSEMTKMGRRVRTLRFILSFFGELIPYAGVLPLWTVFTYFELKS